MPGFCWLDLKTRDLAGTAALLSAVFGWEIAEDGERPTIRSGGHRIGGVSDLANPVYPPGVPAHVAYYVAVDDADGRTDAAARHGATVVLEPFDVGGQGRMATLVDPQGAAFSVWQAGEFGGWTFQPGTPSAPGRMVLSCSDPVHASDFYERTLGGPLDGVTVTAAPGQARWDTVVTVADPVRAAALASEHGGDVTWHGPTARIGTGDGASVLAGAGA
ncbi:VOC family protein [Prauserella cavernicola]|uniref:VOC family protein n=1 Tax=Prauserella cavernicola TaxID=2800127 RepID=A0A934QTH5_9PSEU|nr:VOC family protein [Prauserella cavernicola]MBK1786075.1 VOC family protein [Prauserella cavernicola]